jgi:hypothetical protein
MKSACGGNRVGRRLFVTAAAAMIGARAFSGELPRAAALIDKILELRKRAVIRAHGRLVVTDARKQQRVFQILVLQKRLARSVNLLWRVTDPPEARTRILVETPFEGRPTVWQVSGERGAAAAVPPEKWARTVLGSDIAIEDLIDDHLTWRKQSVTGEETVSGKMCYVVRSEAAEERASIYESVTSWVDEDTLVPLRMVKEPRGPGAPKEIVCRGVRKTGGHWSASNVEFRIQGSAASTKIVFTGGSENARVQDGEIDPKSALGADGESR